MMALKPIFCDCLVHFCQSVKFHVEQPLKKLCQLNTRRSRASGAFSKFHPEKSNKPVRGGGNVSPLKLKAAAEFG